MTVAHVVFTIISFELYSSTYSLSLIIYPPFPVSVHVSSRCNDWCSRRDITTAWIIRVTSSLSGRGRQVVIKFSFPLWTSIDIPLLLHVYPSSVTHDWSHSDTKRIGDIIVRVLTSNVVDRVFESPPGQTKDYTIGMCCFFAKHAALRRKSKDWLAWNQASVSEWGDMSIRGLLF